MSVHATAIVGPGAHLGPGVTIGPYTVIGSDVVIGRGTRIGPHVIIEDGVRVGAENEISAGATLGTAPQDRHFKGERSFLEIGDGNAIREYVNISRATGPDESTVIGDECLIMSGAHIGHNCHLGNRVVIVNDVQLAGHVHIGDDAYLGGLSACLQFVHIGRLVMVGGYSGVRQDVPPFMLVEGRPARARALNRVGLQRRGITGSERLVLRRAFHVLYGSALGVTPAVERLTAEMGDQPLVAEIVAFLRGARDRGHGVVRRARNSEQRSSEQRSSEQRSSEQRSVEE